MSRLLVDQKVCTLCGVCAEVCPFGAIDVKDQVVVGEDCRLCGICVKECPAGALRIEKEEAAAPTTDLSAYKGVMVFVEQRGGVIQEVAIELIGKALELAGSLGEQVSCVLVGCDVTAEAKELLHYGVDRVYLYDHPELRHFRIEPYTAACMDAVEKEKPSIILVGATRLGRSLGPRLATRLRTGLTADCTILEVRENGDLVQTRPAFGGNVMARILTPHHRPQMATVRYKVMAPAQRRAEKSGEIVRCSVSPEMLRSSIEVIDVYPEPPAASIAEADVIVAGGRGLSRKEDLSLLEELAELLGGMVAVTRPLVEAGWAPHTRQVGLSGRTIRPKLLIACGISGAIQFVAGMKGAETVVAINKDKDAPIFAAAHYGVVGDLYEVVPRLIAKLRSGQQVEEAV